jgi:polysaccharide deacetylase family protein (PEP-CTERM system associated)
MIDETVNSTLEPVGSRHPSLRLVPPTDPTVPGHVFTVDVEDWYQSCIDLDAPISERVVRNTDRLLALLDGLSVKGTFFVQGMVAEAFPELVATLVDQGHEVQSHGYSHRPLHRMNPAELRDELERGKAVVEDAAGTAVTAFRAQDFSILKRNLWALETVADLGFSVDSSIFPMRSRHYGIADSPLEPYELEVGDGRRILEVPVAVWSTGGIRVPVAGGGYFRLLPPALFTRGLRAIANAGRPAVVYCHPYELNREELDDFRNAPAGFRFMQGLGRRSFASRLTRVLTELRFGRLSDVLAAWGIAPQAQS